jgi:hypothetical protein
VGVAEGTRSTRVDIDSTGEPNDERNRRQNSTNDMISSHGSNRPQQVRVQPQDEEKPTALTRKRRMETEDSHDSLRPLQPQEDSLINR